MTVRLSMNDRISTALQSFQHTRPSKPMHSPHPHQKPAYGSTTQHAPEPDNFLPLSPAETTKLQAIAVNLLHHARDIDDKILVSLDSIATQTYATTKKNFDLTNHLLNHASTYPKDGIACRKSHKQLANHSGAGCLNESKAKSRASAHMCLSEDAPMPTFNGVALTIAQMTKHVVSSTEEAELASLFATARKHVVQRQTLNEMRWPQKPTPTQVDNTTAFDVFTNNIIPKQNKSIDMRIWWLRCRANQKYFRPYWVSDKENYADCTSKHHSGPHHKSKEPLRAELPTT